MLVGSAGEEEVEEVGESLGWVRAVVVVLVAQQVPVVPRTPSRRNGASTSVEIGSSMSVGVVA